MPKYHQMLTAAKFIAFLTKFLLFPIFCTNDDATSLQG